MKKLLKKKSILGLALIGLAYLNFTSCRQATKDTNTIESEVSEGKSHKTKDGETWSEKNYVLIEESETILGDRPLYFEEGVYSGTFKLLKTRELLNVCGMGSFPWDLEERHLIFILDEPTTIYGSKAGEENVEYLASIFSLAREYDDGSDFEKWASYDGQAHKIRVRELVLPSEPTVPPNEPSALGVELVE